MHSVVRNKKKPDSESESEWDSPSEAAPNTKPTKGKSSETNPGRSVSAITRKDVVAEISDSDQKSAYRETPKRTQRSSKVQESKKRLNMGSGDPEKKPQVPMTSNKKQVYESTTKESPKFHISGLDDDSDADERVLATLRNDVSSKMFTVNFEDSSVMETPGNKDDKFGKLSEKFHPAKSSDKINGNEKNKDFQFMNQSSILKDDNTLPVQFSDPVVDFRTLEYENRVYYFEKGSNRCLIAENREISAKTVNIADESSKIIQRIWQEFFGVFRIITNIFTIFLLEFLRFSLHYVLQPILVGSLTLVSDYMVKPLCTTLFNGFLQPILILSWNLTSGLCGVVMPFVDILRAVMESFAVCVRAFRFVEINRQDGTLQRV